MKALVCKNCGGRINGLTYVCKYCGTKYERINNDVIKIIRTRALAEEIVKFMDLETVYLPEYNAESVRGRVRIVKLDTKYY